MHREAVVPLNPIVAIGSIPIFSIEEPARSRKERTNSTLAVVKFPAVLFQHALLVLPYPFHETSIFGLQLEIIPLPNFI